MSVANSKGKSVGGVVGSRHTVEVKKHLRHLHNLLFFGSSVAYYRLLYLKGSVFEKGDLVFLGGKENDSSRLRNVYSGFLVVVKEKLLNGIAGKKRKHQ